MKTRTFLAALTPALVLVTSPAFAADAAPATAPSALTDAQRDEVRALVKEVLADAGQRGTFASGVTAGIDDKGKIFLKSEDDKFLLNIKGRLEFRYILNNQNNRSKANGGETQEGFQSRRNQLWFEGHIGNPRVKYQLMVAADRDTGTVSVADANLHYELSDEWAVKAGKFKQPFAREELISSGNQLMVDRSSVLEFYTLDRGNAVQLEYQPGPVKIHTAYHSGGNTEATSSYNTEPVSFAMASRIEFLAFGTEKDMIDNVALASDKTGLLLGAAADFEKINPVGAGPYPSGNQPDTAIDRVFSYTGDVTYKVANWAFNVAGYGSNAQGSRVLKDYQSWGVTVSADYRINEAWDVFANWQMLDDGDYHMPAAAPDADDDLMHAITMGATYRLNPRLRLTGDVTWFYETNNVRAPYPLNSGQYSGGHGYSSKGLNGDDGQFALRLQAQLQF